MRGIRERAEKQIDNITTEEVDSRDDVTEGWSPVVVSVSQALRLSICRSSGG